MKMIGAVAVADADSDFVVVVAAAAVAAATAAAVAVKRYQFKRPRIVTVKSPQDSPWRAQPSDPNSSGALQRFIFFRSGSAWFLVSCCCEAASSSA